MRTIKFRVWDRKQKRMFYPVSEDVAKEGDLIEVYFDAGDWDAEALQQDVMQFTGLQDSNGKDIYEGDLVEINYFSFDQTSGPKYCAVEWSDAKAGFVLKSNRSDIYFMEFPILYCKTGLIKGNIFEQKIV